MFYLLVQSVILISMTFSDVISIEKTNELFRLIYDVKGRFIIHRITPEEAKVSNKRKNGH